MGDVLPFDQVERTKRANRSAAAAAGRKGLGHWDGHLENLRRLRRLSAAHCAIARLLTNYPSATFEGLIFASQPKLAAKVGVAERTLSRTIAALKAADALIVRRRGKTSALYVFAIDGVPISDTAACRLAKMAAHVSPEVAGQEAFVSPKVAIKSYLPTQSSSQESPLNPPDIDDPSVTVTFDQFWQAITHDPGEPGPALSAWGKLSRVDRRKIADLIGPHGLDLDGAWASVWLKQRRFDAEPLRRRRASTSADATAKTYKPISPGTPEWIAERARQSAAGNAARVRSMDESAETGGMITIEVAEPAPSRNITEAIDRLVAELEDQ